LLQRIALLFFNPVAIVGAIWVVSLKKAALVALPFIGLTALLCGGGLPLKVVIILSAMPVAFNALIPPSIYELDLDLANSCWFFTTPLLIVVLPVRLFVLRII
jgi:predicted permease